MKGRRLTNVIVSIVSCLLTLLVLEVSLRLYGYDSLLGLRNGREIILRPSEHPLVRYELTPGASGRAWETNIAINSHGFRGPEPMPHPYSGYRILFLGDSITMGISLKVVVSSKTV